MKASEARALTEASPQNRTPIYRQVVDQFVEREANAGNSSAHVPTRSLGAPKDQELELLKASLESDGYTVRIDPVPDFGAPGSCPTLIVSW